MFLDLGEDRVRDFLELVSDLAVAGLELVDFVESVLTLITRLNDELISTGRPVVALDATVDHGV
jgi:energy-converting hydrogenase Eha subunit H